MKEKKARVEDALNATRAAVEEGIVAGGGVRAAAGLVGHRGLKLEGDEKVGAMIVRRALEEPIRRIVENAGLESSVVVEKVKAEKGMTRGFDAESLEFVDMIRPASSTHQGRAGRAAERGVGGLPPADHGGTGHRPAGGEGGGRPANAARGLLGPGVRAQALRPLLRHWQGPYCLVQHHEARDPGPPEGFDQGRRHRPSGTYQQV